MLWAHSDRPGLWVFREQTKTTADVMACCEGCGFGYSVWRSPLFNSSITLLNKCIPKCEHTNVIQVFAHDKLIKIWLITIHRLHKAICYFMLELKITFTVVKRLFVQQKSKVCNAPTVEENAFSKQYDISIHSSVWQYSMIDPLVRKGLYCGSTTCYCSY